MNLSYMGLETGHWYDGDCGWRIYVANETVCLHFEGQCNDFDFLRQMQGFRDYVKEALESGKYKENEKYLSKSLKCYNLWILDFLSKVRLNENFEPVAGKYLRGENWDFDITFEEILRKYWKKRISLYTFWKRNIFLKNWKIMNIFSLMLKSRRHIWNLKTMLSKLDITFQMNMKNIITVFQSLTGTKT